MKLYILSLMIVLNAGNNTSLPWEDKRLEFNATNVEVNEWLHICQDSECVLFIPEQLATFQQMYIFHQIEQAFNLESRCLSAFTVRTILTQTDSIEIVGVIGRKLINFANMSCAVSLGFMITSGDNKSSCIIIDYVSA